MIETKDLILRKAVFEDWADIYRNAWSRPDCARYMLWNVTTNDEDAKARILRTIRWQSEHDAYFVCEKKSGQAIGFTGIEQVPTEGEGARVYEEGGICIGTEFQRRGYGRQVVQALLERAREVYGAAEFQYSAREANLPSQRLAESFGFVLHHKEQRTDNRDGSSYTMLVYRKKLV